MTEPNAFKFNHKKLWIMGMMGNTPIKIQDHYSTLERTKIPLELGKPTYEEGIYFLQTYCIHPPINLTITQDDSRGLDIILYSTAKERSEELIVDVAELVQLTPTTPSRDFVLQIKSEVGAINKRIYDQCERVASNMKCEIEAPLGVSYYSDFLNSWRGMSMDEAINIAKKEYGLIIPQK